MHETSLMRDLLQRIEIAAATEGAKRVIGIEVWLGALTNMSAEDFMEHFEHAAAGTIAEGARVDITVSEDTQHVNAQEVLLQGVEIEV